MAAYERIAGELRQRIRAGQLRPGEKLPAETNLADEYRKSVPTVRQALAVLQAEGLIEKRHGRGNFVRKPRKLVQRTNQRHQWEKDRVREDETERRATGATEHDTGLTVSDLVFSAEYHDAEADEDLAETFGIEVGTPLLERVYRTRYSEEDAPFNLAHSYLVRDMVAGNPDLLDASNEPWPGGSQNQLYTVGIELDRITERITARPPTVEEAEALGLSAGVSVIILRKVCVDTDGRVVEVADVTMPGDRTEILVTTPLARW
ncbi:GntR family transcriptional regulator [Streptomyces buecherae]|uniref:GntR family transcriptional regulator n=1 Tax=Streptomyces buecherae TaxID=2763006 RepID=UPI001C264FD6|nr:GntR family transcriptional regulator [Streptomyces buecherae]